MLRTNKKVREYGCALGGVFKSEHPVFIVELYQKRRGSEAVWASGAQCNIIYRKKEVNTLVAKGVHLLTCIKVNYQRDDNQIIYDL